jgi:ABC-type transport system substrate-binding protein
LAKKALAESGYDGTPVVLMAPGDVELNIRSIAADIQKEVYDQLIYIPLGQFLVVSAWRKSLSGVLDGPATPIFWKIAIVGDPGKTRTSDLRFRNRQGQRPYTRPADGPAMKEAILPAS